MQDPVVTDPSLYRVVFENDRVRVLEYLDSPGDATHVHSHPDSVMITLSVFERVLTARDSQVHVALEAGQARWLDAQEHQGRNVGSTPTHSIFVELKEPRPSGATQVGDIGPSSPAG